MFYSCTYSTRAHKYLSLFHPWRVRSRDPEPAQPPFANQPGPTPNSPNLDFCRTVFRYLGRCNGSQSFSRHLFPSPLVTSDSLPAILCPRVSPQPLSSTNGWTFVQRLLRFEPLGRFFAFVLQPGMSRTGLAQLVWDSPAIAPILCCTHRREHVLSTPSKRT